MRPLLLAKAVSLRRSVTLFCSFPYRIAACEFAWFHAARNMQSRNVGDQADTAEYKDESHRTMDELREPAGRMP